MFTPVLMQLGLGCIHKLFYLSSRSQTKLSISPWLFYSKTFLEIWFSSLKVEWINTCSVADEDWWADNHLSLLYLAHRSRIVMKKSVFIIICACVWGLFTCMHACTLWSIIWVPLNEVCCTGALDLWDASCLVDVQLIWCEMCSLTCESL